MSNTDSFIDEVSDEVRRDKLYATFKRWGWVGVLFVVVVVGAAAWNEWNKAQEAATAAAAGDALYGALVISDPAERLAALEALSAQDPVTRLLVAAEANAAGELATSVETYQALANDMDQPKPYRDLAALRAVMAQAGQTPAAERIAALQQLALPGQTFAILAQEQLALALIEDGQIEAARAQLVAIAADATATEGLRGRVETLMVALDAPAAEVAEDAAEAATPAGQTEPAAN